MSVSPTARHQLWVPWVWSPAPVRALTCFRFVFHQQGSAHAHCQGAETRSDGNCWVKGCPFWSRKGAGEQELGAHTNFYCPSWASRWARNPKADGRAAAELLGSAQQRPNLRGPGLGPRHSPLPRESRCTPRSSEPPTEPQARQQGPPLSPFPRFALQEQSPVRPRDRRAPAPGHPPSRVEEPCWGLANTGSTSVDSAPCLQRASESTAPRTTHSFVKTKPRVCLE